MCVCIYIYFSDVEPFCFTAPFPANVAFEREEERERAKKKEKKKSYVAQNNLADVEKQCAHCWIFLCRLQ